MSAPKSGSDGLAATRLRVTVPASTANLGPGFDALGMALALYDEVEVEAAAGAGSQVTVIGEGAADLPADDRHLVVRALRTTCDHLGIDPGGLRLRCRNQIPHARGLGSSAAAAVAGVVAGYGLAERKLDPAALAIAAEFDGHADNAAASLYGGLVITWRAAGEVRATRLEPHESLDPVVLVPKVTSSTAATRRLLPERVPHADAAFTAGRAALAVYALTSQPRLLLPATADRLHQEYRRSVYPATGTLIDALRGANVAAAISGAGPTVLALPAEGALPESVDTSGFEIHRLPVDRSGARVGRC